MFGNTPIGSSSYAPRCLKMYGIQKYIFEHPTIPCRTHYWEYTCTFFVSCTVAVDVAVAVAVAVTIVPRRVQQPPPLRYIKRYFQTLRRACTAHMTYAQGPLTPRMKCQLDACSSFPFNWVMDINRMPLSRYVQLYI